MISLTVKGLSKFYNSIPIITDLNFRHSNGILGITGANGSGKSTLLKCIANLTSIQKGTIEWHKFSNKLDNNFIIENIGFVAPYINLYDELTVSENLEFLLNLTHKPVQITYLNSIIDQVQMKPYRHKLFSSLSTGQQQRIKIASALIKKPDIIFFDEPGSNLDKEGHEMIAKIVNMQKAKNKLVIIASNDPNEIELCDQVITL